MISRTWAAAGAAIVLLTSPALAQPSGDPSVEAFDSLLDTFEAMMLERTAESDTTSLAVVEAETIAEVATELMEEGETDLATELLGEALALLSPPPSDSPPESSESP